jgi:hypothetical protein
MTDQYDELKLLVADAVRQARKELSQQYGSDKLFAFALCTDDDVRTLYHVACTQKWVQERDSHYPGIGFIYVEWEQDASDSVFRPLSEKVAELANQEYASDQAWADARDRRFDAFVLALNDCRNEGIFDDDTLLCCGSTDPSGHMEALAMEAVDKLNIRAVADQFAEHLGYSEYRDNNV